MDVFSLTAKLGLDASAYEKGIAGASKSFEGFAQGISAKAVAMGNLIANIAQKAFSSFSGFLKNSITSAADNEAAVSLYKQVFGELESTASGALEKIGKDTNILGTRLRVVGTNAFMQFKGAGMDAVSALSNMDKYTRLAADAAAAYNMSIEDADERMRSFLRGNVTAGTSIGLMVNDATRSAKAIELYGKKWNKLTEAQKENALLDIAHDIYEQSNVIGQAEREGHEWENVVNNLKKAWSDLGGTFGGPIKDALIPVFEKLTTFFSDKTIIARVMLLASKLGNIAGYVFDGVIGFIDSLIAWSNGEGDMPPAVQAISEISDALSPIGAMVFENAQTFLGILFGSGDKNAAVKAGAIGLIALALRSITGFVYTESINFINALFKKDGVDANSPGAKLAGAAKAIGDIANAVLTDAATFIEALFAPSSEENGASAAESLASIATSILDIAGAVLDNVISFFGWIFGPPDEAADSVRTLLSDIASDLSDPAFQQVAGVLLSIAAALLVLNSPAILIAGIVALIAANWKSIKEWCDKALSSAEAFLNKVWTDNISPILEPIASAIDAISSAAQTAINWVNQLFGINTDESEYQKILFGGGQTTRGFGGGGSFPAGRFNGGEASRGSGGGGSFATGLSYVPYNEFPARLHEGEAVLTKAEATDWRRGAGSGAGIDMEAFSSAIASAVSSAVSGMAVQMDGQRVGVMVTNTVSRQMAQAVYQRRYT